MISRPVILENKVQEYAWGSKTAIQNLLGKAPDHKMPWAELWMGAHPKAPSTVRIGGEAVDLDQLIEQYPEEILGRKTARKFGNALPYLFKVLAADEPLSIQAHPDAFTASDGFDRENRMNIPMNAPNRNYRDPRAKPECLCALEPFVALNGFRAAGSIVGLLELYCPVGLRPAIDGLKENPDPAGIKTFFQVLMTLDSGPRETMISEAIENAKQFDSDESRWVTLLAEAYPGDIGILSPLFMNLIHLNPGQAMFLPPGRLHAYLFGVGIELMGNSDNVLRGGLTNKHVDKDELMRSVVFEPTPVNILVPEVLSSCEKHYRLDLDEFDLCEISTDLNNPCNGPEIHSAEILLWIEGTADLSSEDGTETLTLSQGQTALVPAATGKYRITGNARIYKASVPVHQ